MYLFNGQIYPDLFDTSIYYLYPIHILNGFISKYIIKKPNQYIRIGINCTTTSINFFILSNLGYFLFDDINHNWQNLVACYVKAIPFFPATIYSNFLYSTVFFALHWIIFRSEILEEERRDLQVNTKVENLDSNLLDAPIIHSGQETTIKVK